MKISSPIVKTVICLSVIIGALGIGIHTVSAHGGDGQHNEWKYTGASEWSSCSPISDQCNERRGKKTRTLNYVCEKKWGDGPNQCDFIKSCSTGIEKDGKCVRACQWGDRDCFSTGHGDNKRWWKDIGYTY